MLTQLIYTSICRMQGQPADIAFGFKAIADTSPQAGVNLTVMTADDILKLLERLSHATRCALA